MTHSYDMFGQETRCAWASYQLLLCTLPELGAGKSYSTLICIMECEIRSNLNISDHITGQVICIQKSICRSPSSVSTYQQLFTHINTSLKMLVTLLVSFKRVLSNRSYDIWLHMSICMFRYWITFRKWYGWKQNGVCPRHERMRCICRWKKHVLVLTFNLGARQRRVLNITPWRFSPSTHWTGSWFPVKDLDDFQNRKIVAPAGISNSDSSASILVTISTKLSRLLL